MTEDEQSRWREANKRYLMASLAVICRRLERFTIKTHGRQYSDSPDDELLEAELRAATEEMPAQPALERVGELFDLSPFERDVLLLCAGVELDGTFAQRVSDTQNTGDWAAPTFSLVLATLPEPDWGSLSPAAPLRYWRLIQVADGPALTVSALRIDERILHELAGVRYTDERLAGLGGVEFDADDLTPSHYTLARRLAGTWAEAAESGAYPVLQLCGGEVAGKRVVATAACRLLELELKLIPAQMLPTAPAELENWLRLWDREARLSRGVLLLDCDEIEGSDPEREAAIQRVIERTSSLAIVCGRRRRRFSQLSVLTFEIEKPPIAEQRALWAEALGPAAETLGAQVDRLIFQFNLGAPVIRAAAVGAWGALVASGQEQPAPEALAEELWATCRVQARPRLDDLAERIEPAAGWDDLILPAYQVGTLRQVAMHMRQRATVYERWGFAGKGSRGLGLSALFAGPSGTGKTMAAEVLARELRLDLYRIDLSAVVSKYIGETEKNLHRVFDAAEEGGVILLFDEADALFGKRSDVKDSHDRYANIEVGYLLQRMESYRGLAILTTNLKEVLDTAFLRRLRFVVQFPFPEAAQRAEIWRRIFPAGMPTHKLDLRKLAQLNAAGGNIRNIALNAAFLAAEADEPVGMAHLLHAARDEYVKLDKTLTEAETRGWV